MRMTFAILAALALAGCKQHGAAAGPGDAPAEVLPGSASDAMIAYDALRSQPPLAGPAPGTSRGEGAEADAAASDAQPAATAAAAGSPPQAAAAPSSAAD